MIRKAYVVLFVVVCCIAASGGAGEWLALGPDGGDARSLAYDPHNPDRIYLGTMAGKLFLSTNGGKHWTRLARLGGDDYVLDSIAINSSDPNTLYVAAWSLTTDGGDVFRSQDGGNTWKALAGIHGKSLRAMALAPSNPQVVVVGALDGVYRSTDGGDTWARISPLNHAEIKNLQSIAIDPQAPETIYAGTWHLPWKTIDGGATWFSIKKGIIVDSDVFSILIDGSKPDVVYASACSGIYKSEDQGRDFTKVKGMPFSARRTRVLAMDPKHPQTVYAGTTEGLWKSEDAGTSFQLMSSANVVVNSIYIDPRNSQRILMATDRGGILRSDDGGDSFTASNDGFTQRQVATLLVDPKDNDLLYAGLLNDKEYGGVFTSRDGGMHWQQMSAGLDGRDVFSLRETAQGTLIAGTNHGIFEWKANAYHWQPINTVINESTVTSQRGKKATVRTLITKSQMAARINNLALEDPTHWYAATPVGLFTTSNLGASWAGGEIAGQKDFVAVHVKQQMVTAASHNGLAISLDRGEHWYAANLPAFITNIYDVAIAQRSELWLATREGVFHSSDQGDNWEHVLSGLPPMYVNFITYDEANNRLLAASMATGNVYISEDAGRHWLAQGSSSWEVRNVTLAGGKLFITTTYDGILKQAEPAAVSATLTSYTAGTGH